jgi:PAS domain-containing protein
MNETIPVETVSKPKKSVPASERSPELTKALAQLEKLKADYAERQKELSTINAVIDLLESDHNQDLESVLLEVASLLPAAWRYADAASARITYGDKQHPSPGFKETRWTLSQSFETIVGVSGKVQVAYRKEFPTLDEGPFCKDERHLINNLTWLIAAYINSTLGRKAIDEAELQRRKVAGQMQAINSSMAYIEFTPEGTIVDANKNFLKAMRYNLEEIKGKHHRIFCEHRLHPKPGIPRFLGKTGCGHGTDGRIQTPRQGWYGCLAAGQLFARLWMKAAK